MGEEMELKTITDLMRERDRLNDFLELIEDGKIEEVKRKIERDIRTITEVLESK